MLAAPNVRQAHMSEPRHWLIECLQRALCGEHREIPSAAFLMALETASRRPLPLPVYSMVNVVFRDGDHRVNAVFLDVMGLEWRRAFY